MKKQTFLDAVFRELPHSNLRIEDLAESCKMDYSYCCKIVKDSALKLGISRDDFITQIRSGDEATLISMKEELMLSTEADIKRKHRKDISANRKLLYDNFFSYKEQGISVKEMAEIHSLDPTTVYDVIQQIGEDKGIPYKELLFYPQRSHNTPKTTNSGYSIPKMVDISAICAKFDAVLNCIAETRAEIKTVFTVFTEEKEMYNDAT